MWVEHVLC